MQATPLFGNVVHAVTSPFRGFLNLVGFTGASGEKEPEKKPSNSYGAPSYKPAPAYKPAPSYHAPAPAPAYHAPAPAYHAPAPAPAYHAPAPSYSAPAPVVVHHAPKPEIHVLPAPDLSHGPGGYAAPAVDTYGSPAAAPAYSAPALDTYGAAASPPVYTPTSNDPAPVDVVTTVKLVEPVPVVEIIPAIEVDPVITNAPLALDPVVVVEEVETDDLFQPAVDISLRQQSDHLPEKEVSIVEFVNVKATLADVVNLRTAEARQPKAINGDSGKLNQVQKYIPLAT